MQEIVHGVERTAGMMDRHPENASQAFDPEGVIGARGEQIIGQRSAPSVRISWVIASDETTEEDRPDA
jgi:hypothetical protein